MDKTWIVSAQCPTQISLIETELKFRTKNNYTEPLVVKGAYSVYLRDQCISYFTLMGPVRPKDIPYIDPDGNYNI